MTSRRQIVCDPRAHRARVLGKPAIYREDGEWRQIEWVGPGEWWTSSLALLWPSLAGRLDKSR